MTGPRRVLKIFTGIVMILCAAVMAYEPESGHYSVILILLVSLMIKGLRGIVYYFTLARYMVGGMAVLYKGLIVLDLGLFALTLHDMPGRYVMLYLIASLFFYGAINVLHAMDARRLGAASWRHDLFYGAVEAGIAIACLFFLDSARVLTYVYCIGLVYAGVSRIITACRKTAIVYIEG